MISATLTLSRICNYGSTILAIRRLITSRYGVGVNLPGSSIGCPWFRFSLVAPDVCGVTRESVKAVCVCLLSRQPATSGGGRINVSPRALLCHRVKSRRDSSGRFDRSHRFGRSMARWKVSLPDGLAITAVRRPGLTQIRRGVTKRTRSKSVGALYDRGQGERRRRASTLRASGAGRAVEIW